MENENLLPTVGAVIGFVVVAAFAFVVLAPCYAIGDAFDRLKFRLGWGRS